MVLFQFLEVVEVFGDYLWVKYLCHAFIMPSTKRNGITRVRERGSNYGVGGELVTVSGFSCECFGLPKSLLQIPEQNTQVVLVRLPLRPGWRGRGLGEQRLQ